MTYYVKVTGSTLFADTVTYYQVKVTGSTLFADTVTYFEVKVTGSTLFADTVTYYKVKVTGSTLWGKAHQGCCTTGMETLTLMTPKSPRKLQC